MSDAADFNAPKSVTTVLGIDFGLGSWGLAVGHPHTEVIESLGRVKAQMGRPDWRELDKKFQDWQPQLIVIGLPRHLNGRDSAMSKRVEKWGSELQRRYSVGVDFADERLTSKAAKSYLADEDSPSAKNDQDIHGVSAALILREWFSFGNAGGIDGIKSPPV